MIGLAYNFCGGLVIVIQRLGSSGAVVSKRISKKEESGATFKILPTEASGWIFQSQSRLKLLIIVRWQFEIAIPAPSWLPQLAQVRWGSVLMALTALQPQPQPKATFVDSTENPATLVTPTVRSTGTNLVHDQKPACCIEN